MSRERKGEKNSGRGFRMLLLKGDRRLQPSSTVADEVSATVALEERRFGAEQFALEKKAAEARRDEALVPCLASIAHYMSEPVSRFTLLAYDLEDKRKAEERRREQLRDLEQAYTLTRRSPRIVVQGLAEKFRSGNRRDAVEAPQTFEYEAEDYLEHSDEKFKMRWQVTSRRGQEFVSPLYYGQRFTYSSFGRIVVSNATYEIEFEEGELNGVQTDLLYCSSTREDDSITNSFLKRFLGGSDKGYFYLNFTGLRSDPKLSVSYSTNGRDRRELRSYFFDTEGKSPRFKEEETIGRTLSGRDELNLSTYVALLKESVARTPTVVV